MKNDALKLAHMGYIIIPLAPRCKKATVKWADLLMSKEDIEAYWGTHPDANFGLRCGDIVVVDADNADATKLCKLKLPKTPMVVSTGKGMHFYYRNPDKLKPSVNQLLAIDIRGQGSYVVGPGSIHKNGRKYLTIEGIHSPQHLPVLTQSDLDALFGKKAMFDPYEYTDVLDDTPINVGGRNTKLSKLVGKWSKEGKSQDEIYSKAKDWNTSNQLPLSNKEVHTTVNSVLQTIQKNEPLNSPAKLNDNTLTPKIYTQENNKFPDHCFKEEGLIKEVWEWINSTAPKAQPIINYGATIALFGTLFGRRYKTATGLRTNVYIVGLADTATGKNHAKNCIPQFLDKAGLSTLWAGDFASGAGLLRTLSECPAKLSVLDEFGLLLKEINSKNATSHRAELSRLLMDLYSSTAHKYLDRRLANRDGKQKQYDIIQPCMSLLAFSTPIRFFEGLHKDHIQDGFLNRMLFFPTETPNPPWQDIEFEPLDIVSDELIARVKALRSWDFISNSNIDAGNPEQIIIHHTQEAKEYRTEVIRPRNIGAIWGRYAEYVDKLALILAVSQNHSNITLSHMEWAEAIVKWSLTYIEAESSVKLVENDFDRHTKEIYGFIQKCGAKGASGRDILRYKTGMRAKDRNEIIVHLKYAEYIQEKDGRYFIIDVL